MINGRSYKVNNVDEYREYGWRLVVINGEIFMSVSEMYRGENCNGVYVGASDFLKF